VKRGVLASSRSGGVSGSDWRRVVAAGVLTTLGCAVAWARMPAGPTANAVEEVTTGSLAAPGAVKLAAPSASAPKTIDPVDVWLTPTESMTYDSGGVLNFALGKKFRDRTISFTSVPHTGAVTSVHVKIIDHEAGDRQFSGVLEWKGGTLKTPEPALINTANILAVTPKVVEQLRKNTGPVRASGHAEAGGQIFAVQQVHELAGPAHETNLKVRTRTSTADGDFKVETLAVIGRDGWPLVAHTTGTIRYHIDCSVDLTLQRINAEESKTVATGR
jgi:hypothetical protein